MDPAKIATIAPLIERLAKPVSEANLKINRIGLYSLPDQYFTDSEISEFQFTAHIMDLQMEEGIVKPRIPTEQEIWEEERLKQNKGRKKKDQEPTPEELEKMNEFAEVRRIDEERLAEFSEEDQFYDISEDISKNQFIEWKKVQPEPQEGVSQDQAKSDQLEKQFEADISAGTLNEDQTQVKENDEGLFEFTLVRYHVLNIL